MLSTSEDKKCLLWHYYQEDACVLNVHNIKPDKKCALLQK